MVKNCPENAGDRRGAGSIPGSEGLPGEEMATHSSILAENPMDRGAWWATGHGVTESRT